MKIQKYMHDYGISRETLAKVSEKAFINASMNPNAWRREPISLEEIANSQMVSDPLTKFMFCSCLLYTSDAADERSSVDLGGRRIIKKKKKKKVRRTDDIKTRQVH